MVAMRQCATATIQHACSRTCCAASTTPSLLVLQIWCVVALEALLWRLTRVESRFNHNHINVPASVDTHSKLHILGPYIKAQFNPDFTHTCLPAVPCVPPNVTAEMVCSNDTGVVSWEAGEGVSSYMVRAFGPDGDMPMCNSTATSCLLPNMHCGQLYNLTVTANDGRCDNSNAYLNLQSGKLKQ